MSFEPLWEWSAFVDPYRRRVVDDDQRELLMADLSRLGTLPGPVLLAERQRAPQTWDVVRCQVDAGAAPGRFLLTGSATPTTAPTHSGAGRIVTVRMRPMSLAERGVGEPSVSLAGLLRGERPPITGETAVGLGDYAEEVVRSGLPGLRGLTGRLGRAQLDGYLARITERDFPEQGHLVRRPTVLRAWMAAYASVLDAATAGDSGRPEKTTTIAYRDVLTQLWLLDPLPAWLPAGSSFSRLGSTPEHHLADPAIAARLLGVGVDSLLDGSGGSPLARRGLMPGALFEALVTLGVRVHAHAAEAEVSHLRTRDGDHEVDLIVHRADRRAVAIEVRLASGVDDHDVRHLRWLACRLATTCSTRSW